MAAYTRGSPKRIRLTSKENGSLEHASREHPSHSLPNLKESRPGSRIAGQSYHGPPCSLPLKFITVSRGLPIYPSTPALITAGPGAVLLARHQDSRVELIPLKGMARASFPAFPICGGKGAISPAAVFSSAKESTSTPQTPTLCATRTHTMV